MAKYVYETTGEYSKFVSVVKETAGNLSSTCSYEDGHIFKNNTVFFVFERYSTLGKNRVSLSITISLNSYEDKIEL